MNYITNRAWAEVNLDDIAHNIREIRKITDKNAEVMGVVKADAYGHGVLEVSKTLLGNGASRLAVATLDEAIQLRRNGIDVPILILSYTDPRRAEEIVENRITQSVFSRDIAEALSCAAVRLGKKAVVHITLDTGMTRVGYAVNDSSVKSILDIARLPGIEIEGLFTHFASSDETDKSYTAMQFEKFMDMCGRLKREGLEVAVRHVANSAAIIDCPEMHLDMVRPGIILYGMYPSEEIDMDKISLRPAMTFKANVTYIKEVDANIPISYGRTYTTKHKSRIATIPVGYADGYSRLLSNKGKVLINGETAPVVGRVCMDQCMVDITDFKHDVSVGDEAVLFGKQGQSSIKIEEVASAIGTINYEVTCNIGKRVPRVYMRNGSASSVLNYLI